MAIFSKSEKFNSIVLKAVLFAVTAILIMFFYDGFYVPFESAKLSQASLELGDYDISKKVVKLSGDARYFDGEFLTGADIEKHANWTMASIPSNYKEMNGGNSYGYGTIYFRVKIPSRLKEEKLAFKAEYLPTAARIFIDGELAASQGVLGSAERSSKGIYIPTTSYFSPKGEYVGIAMQFSNFDDISPKMKGFYLGTVENISKMSMKLMAKDFFMFGGFVIMFIKFFILYMRKTSDREYIYFSLLCLSMAVRVMLVGERFIVRMHPDMPWSIFAKVTLFTVYFGAMFFVALLNETFNNIYSPKIHKAFLKITAVSIVITLITDENIYGRILIPYEAAMIFVMTYSCMVILKAAKEGENSARSMLAVVLLLVACVINDVLNSFSIIDTMYSVSFGIFFLIFVQSNILSQKFVKALKKSEKLVQDMKLLNESLEIKIAERTREIDVKNRELMSINSMLVEVNKKLEKISCLDSLTGIPNRRKFDSYAVKAFEKSRKAVLFSFNAD